MKKSKKKLNSMENPAVTPSPTAPVKTQIPAAPVKPAVTAHETPKTHVAALSVTPAIKPQQVASSPKPARVSLEFARPGARRVCVAGSFNQWKPDATPLSLRPDGRWIGELTVPPGRYEYLFVVDGQWVLDPKAAETTQNPFGGKNAVLTISA